MDTAIILRAIYTVITNVACGLIVSAIWWKIAKKLES